MRTLPQKRLAVLGAAVVAYVLAAWATVPGFFDGFAPPASYNWVSPPPDFRSSNRPPASASTTIGVVSGVSQAGHLATSDSQALVTFPARSFEAPEGGGSIGLEVRPAATYPDLGGIAAASNVYLVSASTRLVSPVLVTLRYVQLRPDLPDHLFVAADPTGPWKSIGLVASPGQDTLSASTRTLGYFVIGYAPAGPPTSVPGVLGAASGGMGLPVIAALAVAIVLLAGVPIAVAQRRSARQARQADQPTPQPAPTNLGGAKRSRRRRRR